MLLVDLGGQRSSKSRNNGIYGSRTGYGHTRMRHPNVDCRVPSPPQDSWKCPNGVALGLKWRYCLSSRVLLRCDSVSIAFVIDCVGSWERIAPVQAFLVRVTVDGKAQPVPLAHPQTLIGRLDDCQIRIRSGKISRHHCEIINDGSSLKMDITVHDGATCQWEAEMGDVGVAQQIDCY